MQNNENITDLCASNQNNVVTNNKVIFFYKPRQLTKKYKKYLSLYFENKKIHLVNMKGQKF